MRTVAECDRRIAELQKRIKQAEADRDLKTARENKETRRLRTRALVILGGCLLSSCGSPLWRVVSVRKSGGN